MANGIMGKVGPIEMLTLIDSSGKDRRSAILLNASFLSLIFLFRIPSPENLRAFKKLERKFQCAPEQTDRRLGESVKRHDCYGDVVDLSFDGKVCRQQGLVFAG